MSRQECKLDYNGFCLSPEDKRKPPQQLKAELATILEKTAVLEAPSKKPTPVEVYLPAVTPIDPGYWSQESQHCRVAREYVKKLRRQKAQNQKKAKAIQQAKQSQQQKQAAIQAAARLRQQEQQRLQRQQQIKSSIQQINKSHELRSQLVNRQNQLVKKVKNSQPLHLRMLKEYQQQIQSFHQADKLKRLPLPTHPHSPTSHRYSTIEPKPLKVYKSKFYQQVSAQNQNSDSSNLVNRQKAYSLVVKEHFKPAISPELAASSKLSSPRSAVDEGEYHSHLQELGRDYLTFVRRLKKKEKQSTEQSNPEEEKKSVPPRLPVVARHRDINPLYMADGLHKESQLARLSELSFKMDEDVHRGEQDLRMGVFRGTAEDKLSQRATIDGKCILSIRAKLRMLQVQQ